MKRLLLISHRSVDQQGGPAARWRSMVRHLPDYGWTVSVVSAPRRPSAVEYSADPSDRRRVATRARVMQAAGRAARPVFGLAGIRPEAAPPSMTWTARGPRAIRARIAAERPDAVLATGPPVVALVAARRALANDAGIPFAVELRDLWAGSPAFDAGGRLLGRVESWVFDRADAVIVCTPEARADVGERHPQARPRTIAIPNGYEPDLLAHRRKSRRREPLTLLHSGTLVPGRPLAPLLAVLDDDRFRGRIRLVHHGHIAPESLAELERAGSPIPVELVPPSSWDEAVERIATADACLVTQGRAVGDDTAVASKVYEYLALGKPVLALTDGGATENLLRALGSDRYCARLDNPASIADAVARLLDDPAPEPVAPALLAPYDRSVLAGQMAQLLDRLVEAR